MSDTREWTIHVCPICGGDGIQLAHGRCVKGCRGPDGIIPPMVPLSVVPEERLREAEGLLETLSETADWYRRCLEDVVDRRPVRGLDEAKVGYDRAFDAAREFLERTR